MDDLTNPYRPGAGARPPSLIGRDELIDRFGVVIRRALLGRPDKSLMPIGLRGVGKTVLLNRFTEIAAEEGYQVAFIEASDDRDFRSALASRVRKCLLALDRGGPAKAVLKALRILKAFSIQIPGGSVSVDVEPLKGHADSGVLGDDITDLLLGVGEAAKSQDTGFLLAIDEVQYLSSAELAALIMAIHRAAQLNLPVVLVGAGLPQIPALAGEAKSYAERLFDFPMIGSLTEDEAGAALEIPAQHAGAAIRPEALSQMVAEAQGYPYFLQEWGYHVWRTALESPITLADVRAARPRVIQQLDNNFFKVRFERLTPKEKEYLRAMAELGLGPHRSGDIAACLGTKVVSVAPRRAGLISKGMIYSPAYGDTAFTVPLFEDFLRRALPDWQCKGEV